MRFADQKLQLIFVAGHFLLTNLLLEKLKSSAPSRVVVVASEAHEVNAALNWDDLQTSRGWTWYKAYGRSKTANILFATHLAKILEGETILNPYMTCTALLLVVALFFCSFLRF